jgi:negative regulator of sigma E activity
MPSEPRVPTEPTLEELSALIDNELDAAEQTRVAEHVAGCADCQARLDGLRQTAHAVRALPMETPPRTFTIPAQPRQSFRWAPVGWIGGAAAALLVVVFGVNQLHPLTPTNSASTSTVSGGLAQGPVTLSHKAAAPVAPPAVSSNDQQYSGQATIASANAATAVDPANRRRMILWTDRGSYATNGSMRVTIELQGSPSTSTNSGDQGLTLTLVRNGTGVALNPVGVISYNGTPVFGGTYDLGNLRFTDPRAGAYRLEATWVIPDGSGQVLQASVPIQLTGS